MEAAITLDEALPGPKLEVFVLSRAGLQAHHPQGAPVQGRVFRLKGQGREPRTPDARRSQLRQRLRIVLAREDRRQARRFLIRVAPGAHPIRPAKT